MLEDVKDNQTVTLKVRETIVSRVVFFHPPVDQVGSPAHYSGKAHQTVDETAVREILFEKLQKKVLSTDRLNFSSLRLL